MVWLSFRASGDVDHSDPQEQAGVNTFCEYNERLVTAPAASDGFLQVADWATHSEGAGAWFETDGVHLTRAGVDAVTSFIASVTARVLDGADVSPAAARGRCSPRARRARRSWRCRRRLAAGIALVGGADGVDGENTMIAVAESEPADPGEGHRMDTRGVARLVGDIVDDGRVDGVHEAVADLADRAAQHGEDGDRDEEADDRVCSIDSCPDRDGAEREGEGREAVGAGVVAVRDECRRADGVPLSDAVQGDKLIADEPCEPGGEQHPDVVDRAGVDQSVGGLPSGDHGRDGDHRYDEQSGEVLGAAVAVGVATVCGGVGRA